MFSALLSKQKLFRMLTGCQKDRKTCRKTDWQTDRRTERQNDFSASSLKGETKKTSVFKNHIYTKNITVNIYIQ